MHGTAEFLIAGATLISGAFIAVAICSRLGVPSIVGFLLAGMALGPHGLELIDGEATLGAIGELGVILLLFMLGLEFSLGKLMELRRLIFCRSPQHPVEYRKNKHLYESNKVSSFVVHKYLFLLVPKLYCIY